MVYRRTLKSWIDAFSSVVIFIITMPLTVVISIILFAVNKGQPFFCQTRIGYNEKPFRVIKFRTMNNKKDDNGVLLADYARLTSVGRAIRKTSLDELPQLINVIKGDMSLIGPRPLLPEYLSLYTEDQKQRHHVKPGITGWAQVNGRNAISWKKKFEFDIWYVNNLSFFIDFKIMLLTFKKVFAGEGINNGDSVTTDYFNGGN